MRHADVILIDEDRYNGLYSAHRYTAWCGLIPDEVNSDEKTCKQFWEENLTVFGGGNDPDEAVLDLFTKLHKLIDGLKDSVYFPCVPRFVYYTGYVKDNHWVKLRHVCIYEDYRFPVLYPKSDMFIKTVREKGSSLVFM